MDTHKSRKPLFREQQKPIFQRKTFKKNRKLRRKFFLMKVSGKSHSAENLKSLTLAKRSFLVKIEEGLR